MNESTIGAMEEEKVAIEVNALKAGDWIFAEPHIGEVFAQVFSSD